MFEINTASDYRDLLARLDTFLTGTGSAFGLTYAGTGTGTLGSYRGGSASVAETFTITATNSTTFSVVGSVSGALASATVGTPYTGTRIQFTITAGGTAFVAGDVFTLSTAPAWTSLRREPGAVLTCSGPGTGTSGQHSFENLVDAKVGTDTTKEWRVGTTMPTVGNPKAVQFDLPAARTVREYIVQNSATAGFYPTAWTFDYWNGSAWVTLDTRSSQSFTASESKLCAIASPVSATRYRINFTGAFSATQLLLNAIVLRDVVGGIDIAPSQYVWQAPNNDNTGGPIVGVRAFTRADVAYWNWELFAADAFDATRQLYDQSNMQRNAYLALSNASIPYWFVADGRRAMVIAKIGTNYETMYLGFIDPFFTPSQYPYPIAMGSSLSMGAATPPAWNSTAYLSSVATYRHVAFTHSDSYSGETVGYSTLRVRRLDGTWLDYFSRLLGAKSAGSVSGWIWPWSLGLTGMDPNLDGTYMLMPAMLFDLAPNAMGQLSGVAGLTGQGLVAEDTIAVGPIRHLVVPNINRTTREDYFAVRLD